MTFSKPIAIGDCVATAAGIVISLPRDGSEEDYAPGLSPPKVMAGAIPGGGRSAVNNKKPTQESEPKHRPAREWDGPRASAASSHLDRWNELASGKRVGCTCTL